MTRFLLQIAFVSLIFGASAQSIFAQQNDANKSIPQSQTPARSVNQTNADENFELNIASRHITENNYQAATAVETDAQNTRGLDLRVGVALSASRIDVQLRNVRGQVRFRGSLDRVLERLNLRHSSDAAP